MNTHADTISPPDWMKFLDQGESYLRTAAGSMKKREKFTPLIVYNLLAMGFEGVVMAATSRFQVLPDNHTLSDLVDGARRVLVIPDSLCSDVLAFESAQELCSVNAFKMAAVDWPEIERFKDAVDAFCAFVIPRIKD